VNPGGSQSDDDPGSERATTGERAIGDERVSGGATAACGGRGPAAPKAGFVGERAFVGPLPGSRSLAACGEGARGEPPADDPAERCCKLHCCVERAPERLQHLAAPMEQYPAPDAALLSMLCDMVRSLATGGYWGSPLSCGRQPKP
jgi:hypothetical protein